ncbi:MAG TPA: carboxypeptidase-like regulatory domain-containing protein, partial [Blastocatellia bacterium]|nr:carboxypeptidase-like regulatory domain-containing protein [Blastocatellia bacterium]
VVDPNGAVIPRATVKVVNTETGATRTTIADADGNWSVAGVHSGPVRVIVESSGFQANVQEMDFQPNQPMRLGTTLQVGAASETVTVTAAGQTTLSVHGNRARAKSFEVSGADPAAPQLNAPSQNVVNLQKRVSGILPVHVDVPRGGRSYRFVRPLVLNEETKLTFQYKSK